MGKGSGESIPLYPPLQSCTMGDLAVRECGDKCALWEERVQVGEGRVAW